MSKLKLLTIAVIGLLVTNIALITFLFLKKAPLIPPNARAKKEGPKKIIIERLKLDAAQIASYEKMIAEHQKWVKPLKDSISNTKNFLYNTLKTDSNVNKDSVITLLGILQKRIETVHYNHFTEIKSLCKPEQIEDFNNLTNELSVFFTTEKKPLRPNSGN